jgi:hypothetical protein
MPKLDALRHLFVRRSDRSNTKISRIAGEVSDARLTYRRSAKRHTALDKAAVDA